MDPIGCLINKSVIWYFTHYLCSEQGPIGGPLWLLFNQSDLVLYPLPVYGTGPHWWTPLVANSIED